MEMDFRNIFICLKYILTMYFQDMPKKWGFVGSIILILLYMVLLGVILITIVKIKDMYAKYILIGILSMFSLQIIGNLAVVMGLVPSTGIPLPILSYGGSTTIVTMAALEIIYNIIRAFYRQELETEKD